ncbi:MAG: hypothetical protein J1D87_00660 [Lachnospiraceae bacterium]|nr:hypothetical protein [Lachnospiraceae bacterium]
MCIFEFDEKKFLKSEREWAREEGFKKGEQHILKLLKFLKDSGRYEDLSQAISDQGYREQLYSEYNL